jgi:hypothetical protein
MSERFRDRTARSVARSCHDDDTSHCGVVPGSRFS